MTARDPRMPMLWSDTRPRATDHLFVSDWAVKRVPMSFDALAIVVVQVEVVKTTPPLGEVPRR